MQYANFVLQGKNAANEAKDGCVRTFDAWYRGIQSAIAAMWAQRIYYEFNTQEFSMVCGYMENLEKPQNCQNWGGRRLLGTTSNMYSFVLHCVTKLWDLVLHCVTLNCKVLPTILSAQALRSVTLCYTVLHWVMCYTELCITLCNTE